MPASTGTRLMTPHSCAASHAVCCPAAGGDAGAPGGRHRVHALHQARPGARRPLPAQGHHGRRALLCSEARRLNHHAGVALPELPRSNRMSCTGMSSSAKDGPHGSQHLDAQAALEPQLLAVLEASQDWPEVPFVCAGASSPLQLGGPRRLHSCECQPSYHHLVCDGRWWLQNAPAACLHCPWTASI